MSKFLCVLLLMFVPYTVLAQQTVNTNSNSAVAIVPTEPQNGVDITLEAVDKYLGGIVGEIFAPDPAPRLIARYTRTTGKGSFYLSSWNSVGKGFNQEADLGVGYSRGGFDFSYTHFFVRGGDIETFEAGYSSPVAFGSVTLQPFVRTFYFTGTGKGSPTGGIVGKAGVVYTHRVWSVDVSHSLAVGVDNNPFGLGQGDAAALGFYTGQLSWRNYYVAWTVTNRLAGDTTRGFRQGGATGYRHQFKW